MSRLPKQLTSTFYHCSIKTYTISELLISFMKIVFLSFLIDDLSQTSVFPETQNQGLKVGQVGMHFCGVDPTIC